MSYSAASEYHVLCEQADDPPATLPNLRTIPQLSELAHGHLFSVRRGLDTIAARRRPTEEVLEELREITYQVDRLILEMRRQRVKVVAKAAASRELTPGEEAHCMLIYHAHPDLAANTIARMIGYEGHGGGGRVSACIKKHVALGGARPHRR